MVRTALLLALETACVLVGLTGVALVNVPAALIIGGVLGVVAVERVTPPPVKPADERGQP